MRFSVLADFVCGFAVLDEIFFGFAVSSIPQCPPLIKPILEYCFMVWDNCTVDKPQRVLRPQKRCARLILDANTHENSVKLLKN